MCMCVYTCVHMCACMCVRAHMRMGAHARACAYVCTRVLVCRSMCVHVHVCVCTHVCTCVRVCTHTRVRRHPALSSAVLSGVGRLRASFGSRLSRAGCFASWAGLGFCRGVRLPQGALFRVRILQSPNGLFPRHHRVSVEDGRLQVTCSK